MTFATDQKQDDAGLSATSKALLAMRNEVLDFWEAGVRAHVEGAQAVSTPILINTLPAFYDNIAEALTPSYPRAEGTSNTTSMSAHGGERARMTRFRADQVIQEYHLFRDAISTMARRNGLQFTPEEWRIVELSIDSALRDAIREYASIHEGLRERLAATLSHDMRNPLAVIVAGAHVVATTPDLDTARRVALKIHSGAKRIERMLTELTDALTFERGAQLPLVITEFDIKSLVETVAGEFAVVGAGRVRTFAEPAVGFWCRNSLHRALENLVSNAFKYGDGGVVAIKADTNHGRLILSVHNTGDPIAEEQRERIFHYLRREGASGMVDGWGIGLPFVRSAAESHGGSVVVDSSAETGTTFIIDIPIDCRPYVKQAQV